MMAISSSIAGSGPIPADPLQFSPSLAILLLLSAVVVALIYAYQPPLPQTMAFSFVPWIATGSLLNVLVTNGQYPPYLLPLFTEPGAYVTALFIPGLVWSAILNVSVSRRALPAYHHYIGAMGVGVVAILWSVLVLRVEAIQLSLMLVLVVVPLVALLAAGLVSLSIGLWSPDFVEYVPIVGGFAVFGAFVNGIATAMGVVLNGETAHTFFSATVLNLVVTYAPRGVGSVGVPLLWVWLFLATNVFVGIVVATQLARFADDRPQSIYVALGLFGVIGFALGFDHLLVAVVG